MLSRYATLAYSRRFLSDEAPKKFKNFAEISQGMSETTQQPQASEPKKSAEKAEHITARPAQVGSTSKPKPVTEPKFSAQSSSTSNRAAGDEYLVPEYSKHNEYSFYDLNNEMTASRIKQPKADRK